MKNDDLKVIRNPEHVKLAIEDTRSDILSLLRVNDMTIKQMAKTLEKDHSTIYRHVKKLEDAGYIKEKEEMEDHHLPKKVYTRTAETFLLSPTSIDGAEPSDVMIEWEKKNAEKILDLLEIMGYSIEREEEDELIETLSNIFVHLKEKVADPIEESEDEIGEVNFPLLMRFELLMFLLEKRKDEEIEEEFEKFFSKLKCK